ncbi:MAG: squalene/phytoene synthase family protein [Nitrospiria bacterium]
MILRGISRSFYLSLVCFPPQIKKQISIAYLFCKIADTLVDLDHFTQIDKERLLIDYLNVFRNPQSLKPFIDDMDKSRLKGDSLTLYSALPSALELFFQFSKSDRLLILDVLSSVTQGMEKDLKKVSITSELDLDQYCYDVAGSAGAFLTNLFFNYGFIKKDREKMISLGIQLGKGLQLTNIIRDQPEDRMRNRFYLPSGYEFSSDFLIYPKTLTLLEGGLEYIISLPRTAWKIRLASFWPLLFALKTVSRMVKIHPLESSQKIKISRSEIYFTMAVSILIVFSNVGIRLYFESIRNRIHSPVEVKH